MFSQLLKSAHSGRLQQCRPERTRVTVQQWSRLWTPALEWCVLEPHTIAVLVHPTGLEAGYNTSLFAYFRYSSSCSMLATSATCMVAFPLARRPTCTMPPHLMEVIWPSKYTRHQFWCSKIVTGKRQACCSLCQVTMSPGGSLLWRHAHTHMNRAMSLDAYRRVHMTQASISACSQVHAQGSMHSSARTF